MFNAKGIYDWVAPFLPSVIVMYAHKLRDKDANRTGADDAAADIMEAAAPLASGSFGDGPAMLKTMRKIEETAHAYRVLKGDPSLNS